MKKEKKITRRSEESLQELTNKKANRILLCAFLMILGLIFLKYIPMYFYGKEILFDASAHLTITFFVLYAVWNFIDGKKFKILFYIVGFLVLFLISYQRIFAGAHNVVGLALGIIISLISIIFSQSFVKK